MIVKVQRSLFPDGSRVLIYSEGKKHIYEGEITQEIENLLGVRKKAYFEAEVNDENEFIIGDEAEKQEW